MIVVVCPHCNEKIEIIEINCGIFRHAQFKNNSKQLDPHATKEECERVVKEELIYGCGKPFKIINGQAIKCGYV